MTAKCQGCETDGYTGLCSEFERIMGGRTFGELTEKELRKLAKATAEIYKARQRLTAEEAALAQYRQSVGVSFGTGETEFDEPAWSLWVD